MATGQTREELVCFHILFVNLFRLNVQDNLTANSLVGKVGEEHIGKGLEGIKTH